MSTVKVLAEITDEDCEAYLETVEVEIELGEIDVADLIEQIELCGYKVSEDVEKDLDDTDYGLLSDIQEKFHSLDWAGREKLHKTIMSYE